MGGWMGEHQRPHTYEKMGGMGHLLPLVVGGGGHMGHLLPLMVLDLILLSQCLPTFCHSAVPAYLLSQCLPTFSIFQTRCLSNRHKILSSPLLYNH